MVPVVLFKNCSWMWDMSLYLWIPQLPDHSKEGYYWRVAFAVMRMQLCQSRLLIIVCAVLAYWVWSHLGFLDFLEMFCPTITLRWLIAIRVHAAPFRIFNAVYMADICLTFFRLGSIANCRCSGWGLPPFLMPWYDDQAVAIPTDYVSNKFCLSFSLLFLFFYFWTVSLWEIIVILSICLYRDGLQLTE